MLYNYIILIAFYDSLWFCTLFIEQYHEFHEVESLLFFVVTAVLIAILWKI